MKKAIDAITGKRTYSENVNGGELVIEIRTRKTDMRRRGDLMRTWVQRGHLAEPIKRYLQVDTYFYDENGRCWGYYNPTEKRGGLGRVIDFEWMLEATPENEARIVAECLRMAAEGVTVK